MPQYWTYYLTNADAWKLFDVWNVRRRPFVSATGSPDIKQHILLVWIIRKCCGQYIATQGADDINIDSSGNY